MLNCSIFQLALITQLIGNVQTKRGFVFFSGILAEILNELIIKKSQSIHSLLSINYGEYCMRLNIQLHPINPPSRSYEQNAASLFFLHVNEQKVLNDTFLEFPWNFLWCFAHCSALNDLIQGVKKVTRHRKMKSKMITGKLNKY